MRHIRRWCVIAWPPRGKPISILLFSLLLLAVPPAVFPAGPSASNPAGISASPALVSGGGISHVQQASNGDATSRTYTAFSAAFNSTTTTGNAILLGVTYGNVNPTISVTDSQGNTYAQAIKTYDSSHNQGCAIFYALNITGGASHRVTVHFGSSVAYLALGIHEYTGIASSSALDVTAGKIGYGTALSSGSATTTANGDLIFGCGVEDSQGSGDTFTAGSGFTKRMDLGNTAAYADEDQVQIAAGLIAATWTLSPSRSWIADMAALKAAGSTGGSTAPTITSLSPTSGPAGTSVTITGTNFGASQGTNTVAFNGTAATPTSWSATSILALVPTAATSGNVVVTVGGRASNGVSFTVTPVTAPPQPPPAAGASPTLVQHASGSSSQGYGLSRYVIQLPNGTLAGNCIIVAFQYASASPAISVTDDKGDTYISGVTHTDYNQIVNIYYALNVAAGARVITISFSGATPNYVTGMASEFNNIATSSAIDASTSADGSGTTIAAGSMTTIAAGDLIYQFAVQDSTSSPIASWTQGLSPWTLLSADVLDSTAAQYQVQASVGTINPAFSMSPAYNWNTAAIAFKSAPAGTVPRTGIRVVRAQHLAFPAYRGSPTTINFPCTGNLIVPSWIGVEGHDLTALSDSNSNTYSPTGAAFGSGTSGDNQIYYAANAACSTTMTLTVTTTGTDISGSTLIVYDIAGAAASPFDSAAGRATASGSNTGGGDIKGCTIAPSTSNGLVITSFGEQSSNATAVSPGNFLSFTTSPEPSPWPVDQDNGWGIEYNSTAGAITFTWTVNAAANNWASIAVAFKAP